MSLRRKLSWGDARELASRLRQRITIQAESEAADGMGGSTVSWVNVATVWAELLPLRTGAVERLNEFQLSERITHRIVMRYRNDVTAKHRISYAGRVFNIRAVRNVEEQGIILEILAEEGVAT